MEQNSEAKDFVRQAFTRVMDANNYRSLEFPINQIPILRRLPIFKKGIVDRGSHQIQTIVAQMINERKCRKTSSICDGNDLLDLLLTAKDENDDGFSDEQVKDEAITFVFAGHETTANLMVWCLYVLMTHPDVYRDCREEVDQVLQGQIPVHKQVSDLQVIDAILHETLRLYPPAPVLIRECIREHTIGQDQLHVPVGALVMTNTYVLHRSETYWRDPLVFDYRRWMRNSDGLKSRLAHPFSYLPFSTGNRNCIGQNFALLEAKVMLAMIIQRLDLELVPGQKVVPSVILTMKSKYGLQAKISRRI
ncbi:unnamed protein product [Didymodactylos carnosus]|nr:unnamed protein product [Didymodactylos carnosus]CAF4455206.1 unnamed protein product [Didymodactylos carnosus]